MLTLIKIASCIDNEYRNCNESNWNKNLNVVNYGPIKTRSKMAPTTCY